MRTRFALALLTAATLGTGALLRAQAPTQMMGAPYHDASRAFIDLMIPHHDMAIMMSEHHLATTRNDAVKAMARKLIAQQQQEIAELKATRRTLFGSDSTRSPMMRGMMQMMGMERMHDTSATHAMMDSMRLHQQPMAMGQQKGMQHQGMEGAGMAGMMSGDMDRMFLEHMISHHQDGIDMAILAEDSQAAARVKQIARTSRARQERDVAEMRSILASLLGAPADARKR
jgi:hypothetical protein